MKKELIRIFLDILDPESDDTALEALEACNEEYLRSGATEDNLVDLYDSVRDYDVIWPQPLGRVTARAIRGRFPNHVPRSGLLES